MMDFLSDFGNFWDYMFGFIVEVFQWIFSTILGEFIIYFIIIGLLISFVFLITQLHKQ